MKYSGIRAFENYKDSKTSKNRRKSATGAKIGLLQLPGSGCDTRGAGWPSKIPPGDPVPGSGTRRAAAGRIRRDPADEMPGRRLSEQQRETRAGILTGGKMPRK